MAKQYTKDPDAVLDYPIVWADWLEDSGDTLVSHSITASRGITVDSSSINVGEVTYEGVTYPANTVVIVWLSGGKAGKKYTITCHIVTDGGREDDRSIVVKCQEK